MAEYLNCEFDIHICHARTHSSVSQHIHHFTCFCCCFDFIFKRIHNFYYPAAAAAAKSLQSCPTLCNPIDGSPPGSRIPGILQARTLEWVAISFSNAWKWKVKGRSLSRVLLSATSWTAAHQAPPSMGFSRQEYWSGVPLLSLFYYPSKFQLYNTVFPTLVTTWHSQSSFLINLHLVAECLYLFSRVVLFPPPRKPLATTILFSVSRSFT